MNSGKRKEVWLLEDEYIDKRMAGEEVDIDDYCKISYLTEEEKQELRNRLLGYEASQRGLEKFVKEHIDADAVWNRISTRIAEDNAKMFYGVLIATYILIRPYIRHRWKAATENRLVHENDDFRWEIFQERNSLIFSMAAKSEELIGKYVTISVISASKVDYPPEKLQWSQEGPENIGAENPIDPGGRIEIVVAETKLDMEKEEDFHLLEQIFEEIELRIFKSRKQ